MSRKDKLLQKLSRANKTFPWSDLATLLTHLGYEQHERAGSRVIFIHAETGCTFYLHKPHPENTIKGGALKEVKRKLISRGE